MLEKSGCHRIITTESSLGDLMNEIRALKPHDFSLSIEEAPALAQCFPNLGHEIANHEFVPLPPRSKPLQIDDLIFYLHSSGSTGFPKPIAQTNRTILGWCALGLSAPPLLQIITAHSASSFRLRCYGRLSPDFLHGGDASSCFPCSRYHYAPHRATLLHHHYCSISTSRDYRADETTDRSYQ